MPLLTNFCGAFIEFRTSNLSFQSSKHRCTTVATGSDKYSLQVIENNFEESNLVLTSTTLYVARLEEGTIVREAVFDSLALQAIALYNLQVGYDNNDWFSLSDWTVDLGCVTVDQSQR